MPVKTPQDIGFKAAAERQYLIFNLMASGKLAYQRGEWAVAVEKWETLLRIAGLDPQIEKAVAPFLADARAKAGLAPRVAPAPEASEPTHAAPAAPTRPHAPRQAERDAGPRRPAGRAPPVPGPDLGLRNGQRRRSCRAGGRGLVAKTNRWSDATYRGPH